MLAPSCFLRRLGGLSFERHRSKATPWHLLNGGYQYCTLTRMAITTPPSVPDHSLLTISDEEADVFAVAKRGAWRSRLHWFFRHMGHTRGITCSLDSSDMDLIEQGLIARTPAKPFGDSVCYAITPRGEAMTLALRRRQCRQRAPHHSLGTQLAEWLGTKNRTTWENCLFRMGTGADCVEVRPDVFSMVATLNAKRIDPVVYEVKVSRADFWADVRDPDKRAGYFRLAPRVIYAAPKGLLQAGEVPEECGWLEQQGENWVLRQRGRRNKAWVAWKPEVWLNLVLKPHRHPTLDVNGS